MKPIRVVRLVEPLDKVGDTSADYLPKKKIKLNPLKHLTIAATPKPLNPYEQNFLDTLKQKKRNKTPSRNIKAKTVCQGTTDKSETTAEVTNNQALFTSIPKEEATLSYTQNMDLDVDVVITPAMLEQQIEDCIREYEGPQTVSPMNSGSLTELKNEYYKRAWQAVRARI